MPLPRQLKILSATEAEWANDNRVLGYNEMAYSEDADVSQFKKGNGVDHWSALAYINPVGGSYEVADESPADGANDTFTFSGPPLLVFRNGVMETRLGSVAGSTFVFDSAPSADDDIEGLI